jgi:A/G-specific adenine glycosylase
MGEVMNLSKPASALSTWYELNKRTLPWREHRDPYYIWISEVMLQQTTVQAVIPYFHRFIQNFPNVKSLASAPLSSVLENWAGLGYYSRARNLHKAAQALAKLKSFPKTHNELLVLPGFGDYTARAVSSIAFDEPVGVVDGNVIRILSRLTGEKLVWWQTKDKKNLQELANQLIQQGTPSILNQAMMELGATICTPTSPSCTLCPWLKFCKARQENTVDQLPIKRPKRAKEIIAVEFDLIFHKNDLALVENDSLPFLKKALLPPSKFKRLQQKPKKFHYQHSITHYQIFVTVSRTHARSKVGDYQWHALQDVPKVNPTSLLKKALNTTHKM